MDVQIDDLVGELRAVSADARTLVERSPEKALAARPGGPADRRRMINSREG